MKKDKSNKENKSEIIKTKPYAKTQSNAGARSKMDDVRDEIIQRTRRGLSKKDRVGGLIHDATFQEWLRIGEDDLLNGIQSQYSEFSQKVKEAEKEFRGSLLQFVKEQAPNDWKAATWLLERSDPDNYKLRDKMDVKQEIEVSQKAILEIPNNKNRSTEIKND